MPWKESYKTSVEKNSVKLCQWCKKNHRESYTYYCRECNRKRFRVGHPCGLFINESDLQYELRIAQKAVLQNRNHESILLGIEILDKLIVAAHEGRCGLPAAEDKINNLYLPDPNDRRELCISMLVMAGALQFFDERHPGKLKDNRHYKFMLAHRIYRLGARPDRKYFNNGEREEFSTILLERLGVMLKTIAKACADLEKQQIDNNEIFERGLEVSIDG